MYDKILTANHNQSCCQEPENLKRQTSVRSVSFAGVDANIVIFIVIILGVNGA